MMQYLVILLDDTSVSFCHYSNDSKESNLMPIETLKAGIVFAMKENLNIQFVYPCHKLPQEYLEVIDRIDHTNIQPACRGGNGEVIVLNDIDDTETVVLRHGVSYVLRIDKFTLFSKVDKVCELLQQVMRLNVVITDVETFKDKDIPLYKECLNKLSMAAELSFSKGKKYSVIY